MNSPRQLYLRTVIESRDLDQPHTPATARRTTQWVIAAGCADLDARGPPPSDQTQT
jgi:hypothetical protein